ncbi:MAG: hypothetical protein QOJ42_2266 [Acidobacteriaceae bacterium]|jgi:hypothetical protein|nr:hypothetical protein [Acidobacteriaceae bacterium]
MKRTILGLTLLLASSVSYANLLVNGGFEQPVLPVGGALSAGGGSSAITGWTVVAPGAVTLLTGNFSQFGFTFPAQEGNQWLDLTGVSVNQPVTIQQTVATTIGAQYDLTFWVGNVVNFDGPGPSSDVGLFVNGVQFGSFTNTLGTGTTTLNWQEFDVQFTATSAATTLGFRNLDPITDQSNGLDNVVLAQVGGPVTPPGGSAPEPSSLALLGLGLGALAARRRKKLQPFVAKFSETFHCTSKKLARQHR